MAFLNACVSEYTCFLGRYRNFMEAVIIYLLGHDGRYLIIFIKTTENRFNCCENSPVLAARCGLPLYTCDSSYPLGDHAMWRCLGHGHGQRPAVAVA